MNTKTVIFAAITTALLAGPVFAQDKASSDTNKAVETTSVTNTKAAGKNRGPIDLEKFTRMDALKAADTNGDGVLSRDEIEALAQKRIIKREADRLQRRLDVNNDGKITLEAIENQRKKNFAAMDTNNDGKLDREEMRAARKNMHGKGHPMKGHHEKARHTKADHKKVEHKDSAKQDKTQN